MLRLLVTPRWLGWLALVILASLVCVWLGHWQWGKYEDKSARADRIERHYGADPAPVREVLSSRPVPVEREWTRVQARGEYQPEQLLVRNRPLDGTYGYEVLVPLRLDEGGTLLVNRGWVANSEKGATVTPTVPAPPSGDVTVTGWVRQGEPSLERELPRGQLASINLREASHAVQERLLGGYVVLDEEQPRGDRPAPLATPDTGTGPHLAYAIQWWLVIPAAWAFCFFALRREARGGPQPSPVKKVRIWDEEDG